MLQEFTHEVEETTRREIENIHTAMPAQIIEFNSGTCTATVKPYGELKFNGAYLEIPAISEVPVLFPYSNTSNVGVIFPVIPGDDCMLLISELELDSWRNGAKTSAPLRFDLTSAVAIAGLCRSSPKNLQNVIAEKAVIISSGETTLKVSNGKVVIKGNVEIQGTISAENL